MVEVLMALVIFAIGFLALQALSIGAIRMVARADRQAELSMFASQEIESAMQTIRDGQTPQSGCTTLGAAVLSRHVEALNTSTPQVTVTAISPSAPVPVKPVTLRVSVYTSYLLSGADLGAPCAEAISTPGGG
jgi:hypothetical protein